MQGAILPLSMLLPGKNALIRKLSQGENLQARLTSMGLIPGTTISVVSNNSCGPLVISVLNSRIAIGRGIAQKILVEELAA